MAVLVSDSFNRANSTTTLGSTDSYAGGSTYTWAKIGSAVWGISSNQAYTSTGANDSPAYVDMTTQADNVRISVDIIVSSGIYLNGLSFRVQDTNNYFRCYANNGSIKIDRFLAGSSTTIANTTLTGVSVPFTISVELSGSTINYLVNGVQKGTLTDTNLTAATKHGMYIGNNTTITLDNFKIESLSSGTTYSGGGTASGVASASSTEVQIYTGSGTTSGMAFASSSETVIAASTTYTGSGTASGTSSASSTETVTFASSGTAQGSASAVGNVAVPTTYTDSGTASGIASASSTETLISSRGTPLNRSYVFLDAARLNPIQVDTNLKVVFDYLNSFVIGIGNIVTAASTSFPVTGLSQTNTQYLVTVIPSWNTTYWITGKTTSGFTINFGTAPASDSTLDWRLMR